MTSSDFDANEARIAHPVLIIDYYVIYARGWHVVSCSKLLHSVCYPTAPSFETEGEGNLMLIKVKNIVNL